MSASGRSTIAPRSGQPGFVGLMQAALRDGRCRCRRRLAEAAAIRSLWWTSSRFRELSDMPRAPRRRDWRAAARHCTKTRYPSGESPVLLLNEAAARIRAGEVDVAAVVGGEALRTAAKRAAAPQAGTPCVSARRASPRGSASATALSRRPTSIRSTKMRCALRLGQTLAEGQAESAAIWSQFSEVAAANPHAWLRKPVSAAEIATPSANNRPDHVSLHQADGGEPIGEPGRGVHRGELGEGARDGRCRGAARLCRATAPAQRSHAMCCGARAIRSLDCAGDRPCARRWRSMGLTQRDLDFVELYSCFPCIPKLARRAIGWPLERPMSAVGGLTFGGGPVGNYMSHAVAAMTEKLRREGQHGSVVRQWRLCQHEPLHRAVARAGRA